MGEPVPTLEAVKELLPEIVANASNNVRIIAKFCMSSLERKNEFVRLAEMVYAEYEMYPGRLLTSLTQVGVELVTAEMTKIVLELQGESCANQPGPGTSDGTGG